MHVLEENLLHCYHDRRVVYYEPQDCVSYHCMDSTGFQNGYAQHFSAQEQITTKFSSPQAFRGCFVDYTRMQNSLEYPKHMQYVRHGGNWNDTNCNTCENYRYSRQQVHLYDDIVGGYGDDPRGVHNVLASAHDMGLKL